MSGLDPGVRMDRRAKPGDDDEGGEGRMKTLFIMMKCELGKAYKVAEEAVETVEQVSEVYSISGQYDLMLKCYLSDDMDIGHFVVERLQRLPDVKDTFTIMAYKAFSEDKSA